MPPPTRTTIVSKTPDSTQSTSPLRARLRDEPLWDFALALYARPGVEAACLALQDDAGIDVCDVLWRCWLYRHGIADAGGEAALADIHAWQHEVTRPLRRLRRALRPEAALRIGVAEVRRHLQAAELAAEQEALARLEAVAQRGHLKALPVGAVGLAQHLAEHFKLQQKRHLLALQRLESALDPSPGPR
jgi:uncharacterized protein (TIGR02444 family)